jgi:hypothetical protein
MELKVVCQCGQKYKFDVEPVNGQMPFPINCPVCNLDGTSTANALLAETLANQPAPMAAPPPPPAPASGGLRLNRSIHAPEPSVAVVAPEAVAQTIAPIAPLDARRKMNPASAASAKPADEFNLGLGILGALLGAGLGAGLMYGFFLWANFRFPLMGTCIGVLTGLGARMLYKGTDLTLGILSSVIALLATAGTLYFMFGDIAVAFVLSMIVSVSLAYKIAG